MMAAKKEVKNWTLNDLGIEAPQKRINLEALFVPDTSVQTEWIEGDTPQEKAERLAVRLREAKLI
jgi:electron transfer flavoprotein alpha/beta subunit